MASEKRKDYVNYNSSGRAIIKRKLQKLEMHYKIFKARKENHFSKV